jgi:hypothetical protein
MTKSTVSFVSAESKADLRVLLMKADTNLQVACKKIAVYNDDWCKRRTAVNALPWYRRWFTGEPGYLYNAGLAKQFADTARAEIAQVLQAINSTGEIVAISVEWYADCQHHARGTSWLVQCGYLEASDSYDCY